MSIIFAFVIGIATTLFLFGNVYILQLKGKYLKLFKLPKSDWLPENSFLQLAALIDTFLPSYSVNELSEDRIRQVLSDFGIADNISNSPMHPSELIKLRKFLSAGALDYGTHRHILKSIVDNLTPDEKFQISCVLFILGNSFLAWILTGYPVTFSDLPLHVRERVLLFWRDNFIEPLRTVYQLFKRLVSVHFMAYLKENESGSDQMSDNPAWKEMGYDPDSSRIGVTMTKEDEEEDTILRQQMNIDYILQELKSEKNANDEHELRVDAVVVGSGCGGGVVAYNLVQKGFNVLVLEKSGYYNKQEFAKWREIEALGKAFDKAGMLSTVDANFAIFAGSCVGGGSTINWSASFETPTHVLQDWQNELKLKDFDVTDANAPFAVAMKTVQRMFNINTDNSYHHGDKASHDNETCGQDQEPENAKENTSFVVNENNRLLWETAEKNGFTAEKIPRNVKDCVDCGHCCYGCAHKSKQSTVHTLLEPLLLAQQGNTTRLHEIEERLTQCRDCDNNTATDTAEENQDRPRRGKLYVLPFAFAKEVLTTKDNSMARKRATGVLAIVQPPEATTTKTPSSYILRIHAQVVCCSAGSVHSPALLLRSKLNHPGIGRGLCLHPVVPVVAFLTKDVTTGLANGVSMGVVVKPPTFFNPTTGDARHLVALETPPGHPAIMSTVLPWQNGLLYKLLMLQYRHIAAFLGIPRDRSHRDNRVVLDAQGAPIVHYRITEVDKDLVLVGIEQALRLLYSDPRVAVMLVGDASLPCFSRHASVSEEVNAKRFEDYLAVVKRRGIQPLQTQLYSAHQLSSVRMAATAEEGPVSPSGELFECEGLFVADGSVLPTSLGINPMLTIEAMAQMISPHIVSYLNDKKAAVKQEQ